MKKLEKLGLLREFDEFKVSKRVVASVIGGVCDSVSTMTTTTVNEAGVTNTITKWDKDTIGDNGTRNLGEYTNKRPVFAIEFDPFDFDDPLANAVDYEEPQLLT